MKIAGLFSGEYPFVFLLILVCESTDRGLLYVCYGNPISKKPEKILDNGFISPILMSSSSSSIGPSLHRIG